MLANDNYTRAHFGTLNIEVQKPATFRHELLNFIAAELPRWRDRPERPQESSETILTSQLCSHLNSVSRHFPGWDILQFKVEEADEQNRGRKIDLVPVPCGVAISVEGRRFTDFDLIMPIECKRLPTPKQKDRDEREYVFSQYSSTGGIQRFKEGNHGAAHAFGGMIGYIQEDSAIDWDKYITDWIKGLAGVQAGWTQKDLLSSESADSTLRLTVLRSNHQRQKGLANIELRHLWIEMN